MLGIYSKRVEKTFRILKLLALHGQLYQRRLVDMVGTSYRNLIRQLQLLEKAGLIELARKEPSRKRGKEQNIWALTFEGLIFVFKIDLSEAEIDSIAANQKAWLIFQEWKTFTEDPEIKAFLISNIKRYANTQPHLTFESLRSLACLKTPKNFQKLAEQLLMQKATKAALGLDVVFDMGAVPPWIYEPGNESALLVRLWRTCVSNPNIRRFIEEQFKYERLKHKTIMDFEKWLFQQRKKGKLS